MIKSGLLYFTLLNEPENIEFYLIASSTFFILLRAAPASSVSDFLFLSSRPISVLMFKYILMRLSPKSEYSFELVKELIESSFV